MEYSFSFDILAVCDYDSLCRGLPCGYGNRVPAGDCTKTEGSSKSVMSGM